MSKENEFPIVFIGSGISKRYLSDYPSWEDLLKVLWIESKSSGDFYGYLNRIRKNVEDNGIATDEISFHTNVMVAGELENKINTLFFDEKLNIEDFSQETAFKSKLSPFKKILSNIFKNYTIKVDMKEEFEQFQQMLNKAQIILTTNYDTLIQDAYNELNKYEIKTYIGQKGFFEQTFGYAELYKLHGCTLEPETLVITEQDYEKFKNNSILISAKIISMLLYSPIIFLGYSLTDLNIRSIIKNFATSLSAEELNRLEKRLVIVEYLKGETELLEEVVNDSELGCRFTVVRTDNFGEIYKRIATIDQGVAPFEVRRYQQVIKKLIIERGKEGTLETVLISPSELDNLEAIIGNKNIVVAIGDRTVIFQMPDYTTYVYDYLFESNEQNKDIVLRYIASMGKNARIPFAKHLTLETINNSSLHQKEKDKLLVRLSEHTYKNHNTLPSKSHRVDFKSLNEIIAMGFDAYKEENIISHNLHRLELVEVENYIKTKVIQIKESKDTISSSLRRLILLYDLKAYASKE